ncbi:NTP transferase domain-containing protein [Candidatus Micrarchaeota archaeon]|nr:NTP transferase domain-containing protein [Candidatus Micrarchaeota archaeon]
MIGIIPAAGSGTRLYPFSRAVPKELYPILGKPVIEYCVENLKEGGISKIFTIVGQQKGALMDYLGHGQIFGVKIGYLHQMERKGLGHAVLQCKDWIDDTFTVLLGDSFITPKEEIKNLIETHKKEDSFATILLFRVQDSTQYGIAKLEDSKIISLVEKPTKEQAEEYKVNGSYYAICGAYVFEKDIFQYLEKTEPGAKGEIQLTDAVVLALKDGKKITGKILEGEYLDMGKWETVLKTEMKLMKEINLEERIKDRENLRNNK